MYHWAQCLVFLALATVSSLSEPSPSLNYPNVNADVFDQPVNLMGAKKTAHDKDGSPAFKVADNKGAWSSYDFSQLDSYLSGVRDAAEDPDSPEHNRIKRRAKRKHSRSGRRRSRHSSTASPEADRKANGTKVPIARKGSDTAERRSKANANSKNVYDTYDPPAKEFEAGFVEMPKDLYQAHLRPGVIFRIHMSEAILKMQYRNYGEDKDESVIEADVEYLRLTRKVINDEITKFEDYLWLVEWFTNKTELIQEHVCNTRYMAVGTPPTMFTHPEEYMKRLCLFDNVYIDHIPYVIGEDNSLLAAVAPPVLHCDAATCTSVPFIDSVMFDEKLQRTNVRTVTRCQASCRAHCKNDADCLKRCSDRCLRAE